MSFYSERDILDATRFREAIHREALEKLRRFNPNADCVKDPYPAEAYLSQKWDYPGAWYTVVTIPDGFRSRDELVDRLVRLSMG